MKRIKGSRTMRRDSRGSALLVSLMVIVGLSLLGLGFVAISETESAISKNQLNATQTQAIAEAGAKMVVEWFQDPSWGETTGGMPLNSGTRLTNCTMASGGMTCTRSTTAIKTERVLTGSQAYVGVYKPKTGTKILDKPYRPSSDDRLFGSRDNPDIIINKDQGGQDLLDAINNQLLASNGAVATTADRAAGEVTEVRIYAPPIVGGVLTNGFWNGGQRYGVATIEVTAQQFRTPGDNVGHTSPTGVVASHAVRLVVGELPLPIPAGPIQGNANVAFGGNFRVHWGMETATGNLTPSLNLSSLPWVNAYERPHFEHGYETKGSGGAISQIVITNGGTGYANGAPVTVTGGGGAGFLGTTIATGGLISGVNITARGTGYDPQALAPPYGGCTASCLTVNFGGGGTGATGIVNVSMEVWPITGGTYDQDDYFHEVLAKDFQDPFYGCRAVGDNQLDGWQTPAPPPQTQPPQLFSYAITAQERSIASPSYAFQWQDSNVYPQKKRVVFPTINYQYWKRISMQGRGYRGIYYFAYDAASQNFKKFNQGAALPMAEWVNTQNSLRLGAGVYFFDTTTGGDPQQYPIGSAQRNALLTPGFVWQSNDFGLIGAPSFLMQGFIYTNSASFGTTGQGSNATTVQANFPGEPFRDIGYPIWCTAVGPSCPAANAWSDCNGSPCRSGAGDATFSCQDLNQNGRCDIVVMQAPTWYSNDPGQTLHVAPYTMPACGSGCSGGQTTFIPKTWKSVAQATADYGQPCVAPDPAWDGSTAPQANWCSEPHEPYLNIIYPDQPANNNGSPYNVVVGWEDPTNQTYRPKRVDATTGNVIPCPVLAGTGPPNQTDCISNAYDVDGAVVPLPVILQGILYVEGQWGSEGNAWFYGSVLVNDTINLSSGTADVWFDEKLLKGTWAPPGMPRVIVFNESTDESVQ